MKFADSDVARSSLTASMRLTLQPAISTSAHCSVPHALQVQVSRRRIVCFHHRPIVAVENSAVSPEIPTRTQPRLRARV